MSQKNRILGRKDVTEFQRGKVVFLEKHFDLQDEGFDRSS
jgi:hypothetical protein